MSATGKRAIVDKPRNHHICGLINPSTHPVINIKIIVGKRAKFALAVAIIGKIIRSTGEPRVTRIPLGITYGGSTTETKPRIGAKIKVNVSRILFFGILFPSL
ncbi:MAG: hypothetical protein NT096_01810 [Proteobacteria bacterium]|nr:hypothetical protein [Pseudomonadota bacterium]